MAKLAGVSTATVSAVVNERTKKVPLSAESRGRVLEAIHQLNYKVNTQARSLRTGRSYTIGVIASDLTQPFAGESIRRVEQEASDREYNFLVSDIQNNGEKEGFYLELFRQKHVEGILFVGAANERDCGSVMAVIESGIPVVLTEREISGQSVPCVLVDNVRGAYEATSYLIDHGHRRVFHIAGPKGNAITEQRRQGYKQALKEHGLSDERLVKSARGMTLEDGYEIVEYALTVDDPPTAIFAFNDMTAFGAIRAIREQGLRVPEDVAIVGFDDIPMAAYSEPRLTTVRQPIAEICGVAVRLLLDILDGKYPRDCYTRMVLQPELVLRESCGAQVTRNSLVSTV